MASYHAQSLVNKDNLKFYGANRSPINSSIFTPTITHGILNAKKSSVVFKPSYSTTKKQRVPPDEFDKIVLLCDGGGPNLINTGSDPGLTFSTHIGSETTGWGFTGQNTHPYRWGDGPIFNSPGPFGDCVSFRGAAYVDDSTNFYGGNEFEPSDYLTISFWIRLKDGRWGTDLLKKFSANYIYGHNDSILDLRMYTNTISYGTVQSANVLTMWSETTVNQGELHSTPLVGKWNHIGFVYDQVNLTSKCYMNGHIINSITLSRGIEYDRNHDGRQTYGSGPWVIGGRIHEGGVNSMSLSDIRFANTIRPLSYFQKVYTSALLTAG